MSQDLCRRARQLLRAAFLQCLLERRVFKHVFQ